MLRCHPMLTTRVIPCFDVDNGRVVKGVSFVELRDAGDPVELAKAYDDAGADELVFLDITASSDDRRTVYDMVERTADEVFIPFTVGGGVRSDMDVRVLLELGADKVSLNSTVSPIAMCRPSRSKNGKCQPPRNKATMRALDVTTATYSEKKNMANFMLEYSV